MTCVRSSGQCGLRPALHGQSRVGRRPSTDSCARPTADGRLAAARNGRVPMAEFQTPTDLTHNRGLVVDPAAFAKDAGAESWLFMCGEEFAGMEGGMSFADIQSAVGESVNLIADPPSPFDMDVARRGVAAL